MAKKPKQADTCVVDPATKRKTFQLKLIGVLMGKECLSSADLEQRVKTRPKKKPRVTATICKEHVHLQYQKPNKNMPRVLMLSPLSKVQGVIRIDSEPRALGFSVIKPGTTSYVSFILIAKRHLWKKKQFADVLVDRISVVQRATEVNLQLCANQHHQDNETADPIKTTIPDGPSTWIHDLFASERKEIQKNQTISPALNDFEPNHLQCNSKSSVKQEQCLSNLTTALNETFATSVYNTTSSYSNCSQAQEISFRESGLLHYMDMLVPLHSPEAATCSKKESFEYVPLHVSDPAWDHNISPLDYEMPSPQLKNINDPSVPDHVRTGVAYERTLVDFKPEFDVTDADDSDMKWFSGELKRALIVGCTSNNGLQHLPTNPTETFINHMEILFNAYLKPKMWYNRNFAITNDPEKLAEFLASTDSPTSKRELRILSYCDKRLEGCWYFPPCCARTPDLELVLD